MSEIEFLQLKGIRKAYQLNKRYNLTIGEMINFLKEYSRIKIEQQEQDSKVNIYKGQKLIQFN